MTEGPKDPPFQEPEAPADRPRSLWAGLGLVLAIGGSLVSVMVADGWPADIAMGLALVGFVALVVAGR